MGCESQDHFQEKADDLPPLQTLEKKVVMQNTALEKKVMMQNTEIDQLKQQIQSMQQQMQSMQQ